MGQPDKQTEAAVSGQAAFCLLSLAYLSYWPAFFLKLLQLAVTLTCYKEQGWCLLTCVHNGKLVELAERNLLQQQQVSLPVVHLLKHRKPNYFKPTPAINFTNPTILHKSILLHLPHVFTKNPTF